MNPSVSLLLLLLTACMVSAAPEQLALWQFGNVISCYQPGVNPLKFNDYGCWCGLGGSGTPVDEVDRCCHVHDKCYKAARRAPGCTSIVDNPYVLMYHYTCTNKQINCLATNDKCQAAVCDCDRVCAQCFAKAEYNPDNKNLDSKVHCVN